MVQRLQHSHIRKENILLKKNTCQIFQIPSTFSHKAEALCLLCACEPAPPLLLHFKAALFFP